MKKLLVSIAGLFCLGLMPKTCFADVTIQEFGTGVDYVDLILEVDDFGPDPVYFRYHYSSPAPVDGYDLLVAVDNEFSNILFTVIDYALPGEPPNYFLNSVTYEGETVTNTGAPDFQPFWNQWCAGGEAGFVTVVPIPTDSWTFGSGSSSPFRLLSPGAADAYVFSDYMAVAPSILPIPEPQVWALCGEAGGLWLVVRRRVRS